MLAASIVKSSSRCSDSARCSCTASISRTRPNARRLAAFETNISSRRRSCRICRSALGRCTLTTTRSPVGSVARCTWAIVPAASGAGSNDEKTSSSGTPSSRSSTAATCDWGSGATSSWRRASSAAISGEMRSRRVDSSWPSFANVGPSSSSVSRTRRARSASSEASPTTWRAKTRPICVTRPSRLPSSAASSSTSACPSPSLTMTTLQCALSDTRLETLRISSSVRSCIPTSESTMRSAARSVAARTIVAADRRPRVDLDLDQLGPEPLGRVGRPARRMRRREARNHDARDHRADCRGSAGKVALHRIGRAAAARAQRRRTRVHALIPIRRRVSDA